LNGRGGRLLSFFPAHRTTYTAAEERNRPRLENCLKISICTVPLRDSRSPNAAIPTLSPPTYGPVSAPERHFPIMKHHGTPVATEKSVPSHPHPRRHHRPAGPRPPQIRRGALAADARAAANPRGAGEARSRSGARAPAASEAVRAEPCRPEAQKAALARDYAEPRPRKLRRTLLHPTFYTTKTTQSAPAGLALVLNACTATKLSLPTKTDDYEIQEFDFSAFADPTGTIGALSVSE